MTTQSARPPERGYHQDYIARIRYENVLPPPPGAPKLLNVPTEGLKYYTSANFSHRLARQQPLNIEADAELGMPIDLVGMPGIFEGDESSIQASLAIPPTHPKDKALLRPLSELGKPAFDAAGYSFLRRTEYISSDAAKARAEANAHAVRASAKSSATAKSRRPTDAQKEDPMYILRSVIKGFDLAYPQDAYTGPDNAFNIRGAASTLAETEAWKNPKHPSKPDVRLIGTYPLKPDLDAITDSGAFIVIKFTGNPSGSTERRDVRMDVGIISLREHEEADTDFDFFLPVDENEANNFKQRFNVNNPNRDDPGLYTHKAADGSDNFRYEYLRTYDASRTIKVDQQYKEVALALHDHDGDDINDAQETGAYYYPITTKLQLKPRRNRNLARLGLPSQTDHEDSEKLGCINLTVGEPEEGEANSRAKHRDTLEAELDGYPEENVR